MKTRALTVLLLLLWLTPSAKAHLGSPDVFFAGNVGPYPAHVTIRMPVVVPGRAEISVRVEGPAPVEVSFLPVYSYTAVSNAPPPDAGKLIRGETNLYTGDLWLMSSGAYSIQVSVHGAAGDGVVEIPVNSEAIRQLPMPPYLGELLAALGLLLVLGGIVIVAGAARDSVLDPGVLPAKRDRRKGWIAGTVMLVIFVALLLGGRSWWNSEERTFRGTIRTRAWPDLTAKVETEGTQRILELTLGKKALRDGKSLALIPDHGKLLHLFLIREGADGAFAHLHPVRKGGKKFQVALPPLPAGNYKMFCDLALEEGGMSFTTTNSVTLPASPAARNAGTNALVPDADDSWASYTATNMPSAGAANPVYNLPDGGRVVWKAHAPLRVRQDAGLDFEIWDASGNPMALEPYMGMMSHAAVMRRDEMIFSHLHPSGNFSMAAQGFFQDKMTRENASATNAICGPSGAMDHSTMVHAPPAASAGASSVISLPYQFPAPGDYRIWVQFKTGGQVKTAVFDATVAGS